MSFDKIKDHKTTRLHVDIDFVDNTSGISNLYDITLNITDDRGCTSDTTHTVELWTRPISIFNIDSLQCGPVNSLSPNNNSLYATGNTDFIWDIISSAFSKNGKYSAK